MVIKKEKKQEKKTLPPRRKRGKDSPIGSPTKSKLRVLMRQSIHSPFRRGRLTFTEGIVDYEDTDKQTDGLSKGEKIFVSLRFERYRTLFSSSRTRLFCSMTVLSLNRRKKHPRYCVPASQVEHSGEFASERTFIHFDGNGL